MMKNLSDYFTVWFLETEAKDHHRLLDDAGGDFDSSSGQFGFLYFALETKNENYVTHLSNFVTGLY